MPNAQTTKWTPAQVADFAERLVPAVNACWSVIAGDCYASFEACGERVPRGQGWAVEACLDADRLAAYGGASGKALNAEMRKALDSGALDYKALERAVGRRVRLN